ncbi:hypothetical protein GCM10009019_14730 [Salarchaeum japonicum]|uniref:Uncharacterized protein n=1 Tax=Salarchaeum japonicum TaxID=555573 RepID=A0AAV3T1H1_9EURY
MVISRALAIQFADANHISSRRNGCPLEPVASELPNVRGARVKGLRNVPGYAASSRTFNTVRRNPTPASATGGVR